MRRVPKPSHDAQTVFEQCNSKVRNAGKRAALKIFAPNVGQAAHSFDAAAARQALHALATMPKNVYAQHGLKASDLKKAYTGRMAHPDAPGRSVYDAILLAPQFGLCPLCGVRRVGTLDHFLPKQRYPELSVVPTNLIPACWECNHDKLTRVAVAADEVPLHPYYDDVDQERWLYASVVQSLPVAVVFFPNPPQAWPATLRARIARHFDEFGLADLYGSEAARELSSIARQMRNLHASGGAQHVVAELIARRDSNAEVWLNDWKTALYDALATDPWYSANAV